LQEDIITIHKESGKEPITNILYCQDVLAWSTKSCIRMKDIKLNKPLGVIERQKLPPETPNKEIKENNTIP